MLCTKLIKIRQFCPKQHWSMIFSMCQKMIHLDRRKKVSLVLFIFIASYFFLQSASSQFCSFFFLIFCYCDFPSYNRWQFSKEKIISEQKQPLLAGNLWFCLKATSSKIASKAQKQAHKVCFLIYLRNPFLALNRAFRLWTKFYGSRKVYLRSL